MSLVSQRRLAGWGAALGAMLAGVGYFWLGSVAPAAPLYRWIPEGASPSAAAAQMPKSALLADLVQAVEEARGVCPVDHLQLACNEGTCVSSYATPPEAEQYRRLLTHPARLAEATFQAAGAESPVQSPCARGQSLLTAPEAEVEVLRSRQGSTCVAVHDAATPLAQRLSGPAALSWCAERIGA